MTKRITNIEEARRCSDDMQLLLEKVREELKVVKGMSKNLKNMEEKILKLDEFSRGEEFEKCIRILSKVKETNGVTPEVLNEDSIYELVVEYHNTLKELKSQIDDAIKKIES